MKNSMETLEIQRKSKVRYPRLTSGFLTWQKEQHMHIKEVLNQESFWRDGVRKEVKEKRKNISNLWSSDDIKIYKAS